MSEQQPKRIHVVHFQRRPIPGFNSIERLFADVREQLRESDIDIRVRINEYPSRGLLPRLYDSWRAHRAQGQVNHVTGDVHYLSWWLDPARTVLTVHDCVGLTRMSGWRRRLFRFLWYTLPARRCRYITVVSQFTRDELLREIDCEPSKIRVIHPHLSDEFQRVDRPFRTHGTRILQIGTAYNKNIERLAQALEGMDVELRVIGEMSDSQRAAVLTANVKYTERTGLSRREILDEYINADIVSLLSTYEGFGLPIIEAQAVGRAVLTSNCASMPEVAGAGACIVDPLDVAAIREAVRLIQNDLIYRDGLRYQGLVNAERFRLRATAREYANLYRIIAAASSAPLKSDAEGGAK